MKRYVLALIFTLQSAFVYSADVVSQTTLPDGSRVLKISYKDLQDGTYAPIVAVVDTPAAKTTYAATSGAFTPDTTPADVFTVTGSATKTIKVQKMCITTTQTTAGTNAWFITKRSTANSGGTSSNLTEVPLDSSNAAATATTLSYTVDTATGTLVGNVWGGWVDSPVVTTAGIGGLVGTCVDFTDLYGQPVALRGTAEVLAWNFNLATLPPGLSVIATATWTEE